MFIVDFRQKCRQVIDPGLARISKALDCLPHIECTQIVSIAGTNGKGSVGKMLSCLLTGAGQSVFWFSSPHLFHYRERFQLNDKTISEAKLMAAFNNCKEIARSHDLTAFEFDFLLAYVVILQEKPAVALLEIGMGGRMDAVNSVSADLSIITSISFDHQEFLGDSLDAIGLEKAAIMRPHKPAIIGKMPTQSVNSYAQKIGAITFSAGEDFSHISTLGGWEYKALNPKLRSKQTLPQPQLLLDNWALALTACDILEIGLPHGLLVDIIANTRLAGRFDCIAQKPYVICDVAANSEAVKQLAISVIAFCKLHNIKKVYAMVGLLKNKANTSLLSPLMSIIDEWHVVSVVCDEFPQRSEEAIVTRERLAISADIYNTAYDCAQSLRSQLTQESLLICFGSFYLLPDCYKIYANSTTKRTTCA